MNILKYNLERFKQSLRLRLKKNKKKILFLTILAVGLLLAVGLSYSRFSPSSNFDLYQKQVEQSKQMRTQQEISNLTQSLKQKLNQYNRLLEASSAAKQKQLDELVVAAKDRQTQLLQKLEEDPRQFLSLATLPAEKTTFPKEVQPYIEQNVSTEGKLLVLHVDGTENKSSKYQYFLTPTAKNNQFDHYQLYLSPKALTTDSKVKVTGVAMTNHLAVAAPGSTDPGTGLTILQLAAPTSLGEQKTGTILINFDTDTSQPISTDTVKAMLFTNSNSLDSYYKENSYNQVSFSGDVYGWYTIPYPDDCNLYNWAKNAESAASSHGVPISSYARLIFVYPRDSYCDSGGFGSIGGNPSWSWIFNKDARVFQHEMGHNLGLHHANLLTCGNNQIDTFSNCNFIEYGDYFDVMGNFWLVGKASLHFNAPHKLALSWIPKTSQITATQSGSYTIFQEEQKMDKPQILIVERPDSERLAYYISYRQPLGFDNTLPTAITSGASIHLWDGYAGNQTNLLLPYPLQGVWAAALTNNQTFTDTSNSISIKQTSHNSDSVTVDVNIGPATIPLLKEWKLASANPATSTSFKLASANKYVYVLGGVDANYRAASSVLVASIKPDGTLDQFKATTPLPKGLYGFSTFTFNNNLYVTGGVNWEDRTESNPKSKVYYAKINSDGTLGSWQITSLLEGHYDQQSYVYKGRVYFVGGIDKQWSNENRILSAKITSDGTLGEWKTSQMSGSYSYGIAFTLLNGYLYKIGGNQSGAEKAVFYAKINDDGTVGDWQSIKSLPSAITNATAVALGQTIAVIGGYDSYYSPRSTTVTAEVQADGSIGIWNSKDVKLPNAIAYLESTVLQGYVFVGGGWTSTGFNSNLFSTSTLLTPDFDQNNSLQGELETVDSHGAISGWAFDSQDLLALLQIDWFIDEEKESGFSSRVDQSRDDINQKFQVSGAHGFNTSIPDKYRDNKKHTITGVIRSVNTAVEKHLDQTKDFTLEPVIACNEVGLHPRGKGNILSNKITDVGLTQKLGLVASIARDDGNRSSIQWTASGGTLSNTAWDLTEWRAPTLPGTYTLSLSIYGKDQPTCLVTFNVLPKSSLVCQGVILRDGKDTLVSGTDTPINMSQKVALKALIANDDGNRDSILWQASDGIFTNSSWDLIEWRAPVSTGSFDINLSVYGDPQPQCKTTFTVKPVSNVACLKLEKDPRGSNNILSGTTTYLTPGQSIPIVASVANDDGNRKNIIWNSTGGKFDYTSWDLASWKAPAETGTYNLTMSVYGVPQDSCQATFAVVNVLPTPIATPSPTSTETPSVTQTPTPSASPSGVLGIDIDTQSLFNKIKSQIQNIFHSTN